MRNKDFVHLRFVHDLEDYTKKHHCEYLLNNPRLDELINNENIQYLVSTWMHTENVYQLDHILDFIPWYLYKVPTAPIEQFFERARIICDLIAKKTEHALALEHIEHTELDELLGFVSPPQKVLQTDGWADLNRPIFELHDKDVQKLGKYAFFINAGIFSANTVLDMRPEESTAFDARVDALIEEHHNLLLSAPDDRNRLIPHIFNSELIKLMQNDAIIQKILRDIIPIQPTRRPGQQTETSFDHEYKLDQLLGLEDTDNEDLGLTDKETQSEQSTSSNHLLHAIPKTKEKSAEPSQTSQNVRKPFRGVIKDNTLNTELQKHNQDAKKRSEALANPTIDEKKMPNWHKQYLKMLKEKEQNAESDATKSIKNK